MWFTPLAENAESRVVRLRTRVMNITDVVNACKETGYEWFEHLLENVRALWGTVTCSNKDTYQIF